jgi:hypothetical protein
MMRLFCNLPTPFYNKTTHYTALHCPKPNWVGTVRSGLRVAWGEEG